MSKDIQYKLSICPALEKSFDFIDFFFDTKEELEAAAETSALLLLYLQDKLKVMYDFSNVFEKSYRIQDGDWIEIE